MENRSWDTTTWVSDPRKIERELGWRPKLDFKAGLKKTIDSA
jgi:dTDP-D-glucose 4,6-dehydratase